MTLNGPVQGGGINTATTANGDALGDCATDSFVVTGSPIICGTNTGQHRKEIHQNLIRNYIPTNSL